MLKKSRMGIKKRGQVTIFIIIAILIVSVILIFFLYVKPRYMDVSGGKLNIEKCMESAVKKQINELGKHAGFIEPEFSYLYKGDEIGYLCYTNLYYKPCVMQKPFVKQHFEEQLERATRLDIEECYEDGVDELKRQGYDVISGKPDLDIALEPNRILIKLDAPTSVSGQAKTSFRKFTTSVNSPIYDMLMVATSILQYETRYGDSDVMTLMMFYPDLIISKIKRGDETKVYIIEDKLTKTKFQFASRSYAWPAGYGVDSGLLGEQ